MTGRFLQKRLGALLLLAGASAPGFANIHCDSPERSREFFKALEPQRKALADGNVRELDTYFSSLLAQYAQGKVGDVDVEAAFGIFFTSKAGNEPIHAAWVKAYPASEAAHLAQAQYYIRRAWAARGNAFRDKTSDIQMAAMDQGFEKAWKALDAAEAPAKRPALEWAYRIGVLGAYGSRRGDAMGEIYRRTLKTDPAAVIARVYYLNASSPRWGGSLERLAKIAEEAKTLDGPERRYVEYKANFEIGDDYRLREDDKRAVEYFERAMPLCPAMADASAGAMRIYVSAKNWPALVAASTRYIAAAPGEGWGWATRAYAYGMLNDLEKSFKDYEHAMQLGYAHAYEGLAWFYEAGQGGVRRDFAKAIDLHMAAHEKGVAGAKDRADKLRARTGLK